LVDRETLAMQGTTLPISSPESQGVSTAGLCQFIQAADTGVDSMHSVIVLRHGHVILQAYWKPESAEKPHVLWSLSKSFTSTAVGLVIQEGKLSLDDQVIQFFPEDLPETQSENLKAMRVRDLLTMTAGHSEEVDWRKAKHWARAFLAHPVPHTPGTHFRYNTPATYMLSAIVQKVTGQTVLEYLKPRLFQPLGIEDPRWDRSPQDVSIGGYGLFLKTQDIAKFGQLYLQQGQWNGKQLVPADWIKQATSKQVSNGEGGSSDWAQGYGFQFWQCRNNAFRGDGKDGQYCIVVPEQDLVVAITANTGNMQKELNFVWDKLLPALHDKPREDDTKAQQELKTLVQGLKASR